MAFTVFVFVYYCVYKQYNCTFKQADTIIYEEQIIILGLNEWNFI